MNDMETRLEQNRDLEELSALREENKALKAILAEWVDMSINGALCCGCNSGEGKHCAECGIRISEKVSKELLGMPEQVDSEEVSEEMICRVCGCTDSHACEGGCYWVEPRLCSKCVGRDG
jgi:hypothetical protein